jgi:ABC-type thiamine transport system ATPase subunit
LQRPQCHPAPDGAVLAVRPLRDIVARMSGILISVQENLSVETLWYSGSGTSAILNTIFAFHFPPSSSELHFEKEGQKPAAGRQKTLNTQVQPNTTLAHAKYDVSSKNSFGKLSGSVLQYTTEYNSIRFRVNVHTMNPILVCSSQI